VSNNFWKIGGAPQCVVQDANLGTYIQEAQIDYIFVQLYNTPECSARKQLDEPAASTNTFASKWLSGIFAPKNFYANQGVKVFAGLVSIPHVGSYIKKTVLSKSNSQPARLPPPAP
jgi:chitinase